MGLAQSISPRQKQEQKLSPKMMMGLDLLAKTVGDLREEIKKEIASNPAIDDVDFSPFFKRHSSISSDDAAAMLENVAARGESLDEHLMRELRLAEVDPELRAAAEQVIGSLDDSGRFKGSVPDIQMVTGVPAETIERARQFVMTLDPIGCGAMDTAECLTAQLVKIPAADRAAAGKIVGRFEDILAGKVSIAELDVDALTVLRKYRGRLAVNPGEKFAPKRVESVFPDIFVSPDGEVRVDTGDIPEIKVSTRYQLMTKDPSLDAETRKYAQERVRRVKELQEALVRRQDTMEKIAELAIGTQRDFLRHGRSSLKRLTMTSVARQAGCSVSTVSRAASRKWVKLPRGKLIPFSDFFALTDQEPIEKLREILSDLQDKGEKLSDQKISELMSRAGFPMARRTVAKYRVRLTDGDNRR